jgi:subtilisin family serine protease
MIAKNQNYNSNHHKTRTYYGLFAIVLILSMTITSAASAQQSKTFTATQLTEISTYSIPRNLEVNAQGLTSVVVKLKGSSLASYQGEIPDLPATSPAVTGENRLNPNSSASVSYLGYLDQKHATVKEELLKIPDVKVVQEYNVVLNAISVVIPASEIDKLSNLPGVEAVYPDEVVYKDTDNSPQFIGAPAVWTALGGQESSGEGIIVGVIDTGIWPEHPSFSDPDPSGKAYLPPPAAPSGLDRACAFSGGSNPGSAFTCNNKLIGAYRELSTYDALSGPEPGYTSARDADGHGTHTSSTSAGNAGVNATVFGVSRGTVSGIAPRAYVIMYKALGNNGGYDSDIANAIQQAILDGVNIINFSVSGGSNPYSDVTEQAFLDAYNAGVFVAASAGNSGPTADTTDHRGGWVTTVAASTQNRAFVNTLTLTSGSDSLSVTGASITAGVGPKAIVVPTTDLTCDNLAAAGTYTDKIVVCARGGIAGRIQKGFNVSQGNAVGMVLYNQSTSVTDQETDNHFIPATHIQNSDGQKVLAFISAHPDAQATITEGAKVSGEGDIMASFSSRGGTGQTLGISKPDITAPGVQILAGASPQHLDATVDPALGPQGESFQAIAGTSMASPHIAGAGALLKALHPDWKPGQIKSALMTTAWAQVLKEDGFTQATTFDDGSGRVDLTKAGDPGLTFDVTGADYVSHSADLWNVNYPSIFIPRMPGIISVTRIAHSTLPYDSTWNLSVQGAVGFKVIVPPNLLVPASSDGAFSITIDASDIPLDQVGSATLYLTETSGQATRKLHLPITFIRREQTISLSKTCTSPAIAIGSSTSCTISATNNAFKPSSIAITDALPDQMKAIGESVIGGTVSPDLKTISFFGSLGAATPPGVTIGTGPSPAGGYLALSDLGISPIVGVGDETITNFNVPPFTFAGETYTKIGVVSNGYVVVGGGTGADVQFLNQNLPDPTHPNNVLAPWWTDFNPPAGGAIRVATLDDGADTWIVVDWAGVKEYSTPKLDTFEVWIGINSDAHPGQDISFAYGTLQGNGDGGLLTVGAENRFGTSGGNYYFSNGVATPSGTLPTSATELVIGGTPPVPGESHTITYDMKRVQQGAWTNYAHMTGDLFQGIEVASAQWGAIPIYLPFVGK